jgi:hypothetical protein
VATFDYKKDLKHLYLPSKKEFNIVEVPTMNFLMIDGHGDPNTSPDYRRGLEALYALGYGIKFALKPEGISYVVPPLEGLWWMEDMSEFSQASKDRWDWTMMIMQPPWVTGETVEQIKIDAARKKELPALERTRFESYAEGLSAQILYFGAYADEGPTILRLHDFIHASGHKREGKHHEIYLGDPRRTPPERLKTVIRQPMSRI